MSERKDSLGQVIYTCDNCGAELNTGTDGDAARHYFARYGWRRQTVNGRQVDICNACGR